MRNDSHPEEFFGLTKNDIARFIFVTTMLENYDSNPDYHTFV